MVEVTDRAPATEVDRLAAEYLDVLFEAEPRWVDGLLRDG